MYLEVSLNKYKRMTEELKKRGIVYREIQFPQIQDNAPFYQFQFGETDLKLAKIIYQVYVDVSEELKDPAVRTPLLSKYYEKYDNKETKEEVIQHENDTLE